MKTHRTSLNAGLITAGLVLLLIMSGCKNEEEDQTTIITTAPAPATVSVPSLQMGVPTSMTYTDTSTAALHNEGYNAAVTSVTDENGCPILKEGEDFFDNGFTMTRFLVVLSENQACYADRFISIADEYLGPYLNLGKTSLGDSGLSAFQIDHVDDDYSLWFWFDGADDPTFYLTWTADNAGDSAGRFINRTQSAAGSDPMSVRFEFTRNDSVDENAVFVAYESDTSSDLEGFHTVVGRTTSDTETSYLAKGIIGFARQFATNLSEAVDFTPSLRMVTVSNAAGEGAVIADYTDVGIRIRADATADLDMGTYRYTLQDKVYFNEDASTDWQYKEITDATYVGNDPRTGDGLAGIILCLETADCDNEDITLGAQYFTDTCDATDGADCKDFMQVIFDHGWGGIYTNSSDPEPSSDSRYQALNNAEQLTELWPSGATRGTDDFTIPDP
jgi:hypothetical protein